MKLINRLTIWYLAITTFVLLASGLIVFYRVQAEIENEVKTRLKRDIDHAAQLISEGLPIDSVRGNQLDLKELDYNASLIPLQVTDSMGFYSLYRGHRTGSSRSLRPTKYKGSTIIYQPIIL